MWWQMELMFSLLFFILWNIIRKLYNVCRFVSWYVTGTWKQIRKNCEGMSFRGTVQVLEIILRHKFDDVHEPAGVHNFITSHSCFVDPEYVLKDHVTLYYMTETEAIFVESAKDKDAANSDNGPFLRQAQYNLAEKVLIMPMHVFLKLGHKVGKPKAKLIFLPHVGRCGSTMVTQLFEVSKGTVALSEPDSLDALLQMRGVVSDKKFKEITICCMNLTCKPLQNREVNAFLLKPIEHCVELIPDIIELFPNTVCVFLYRNALATARSLSRISYTAPLLQITMLLGQYSPNLTKFVVNLMGMPSETFDTRLLSRLHVGALLWASTVRQYLNYRDSGMKIIAIRYEDIIEDRYFVFKKVFEFCNIPFSASAIDKAMSRDSERGSSIGRERTQKYRSWVDEYTDYVKEHTDKACDAYNVPRMDDYQILPGTVSCRNNN